MNQTYANRRESRKMREAEERLHKQDIKRLTDRGYTPTPTGIGAEFDGGHKVVRHSHGEYANGDTNTNSAESFFSLIKRGVYGTFHHVSKEHLHRYCDEFAFRWNYRNVDDIERMRQVIAMSGGKRLTYRQPNQA